MSDYIKIEKNNLEDPNNKLKSSINEECDSNTDPEGEENLYKEIKETEIDNDGENRNIKEEDKVGVCGATTTIIKAIIGSGITNMPMLFKVLGIIPALILMLINLLLHINTVRFLMICKKITQRYSYSFYSRLSMGTFGSVMIKAAISLLSFCTCCVYLKFFGNTIYMLVTLFIEQKEGFLYTKNFYIILVFFVIMPLMFKRDLSALKNPAKIGVFGIFLSCITTIIVFIYKWINGYQLHIDSKFLYPSGSWMEIVTIIPASLDAFIFQHNTFPIYTQLKPRNSATMMKSSFYGVFFSFFAFSTIGILGLFSYGLSINDFILVYIREDIDTFKGDKFIFFCSFIMIISFFVSVVFSFPINFLNTRNNMISLVRFFKDHVFAKKQQKTEHTEFDTGLSLDRGLGYSLFTIGIYVFTLLVAILAKRIIEISNVSGVSCNNYISMLSPSLFILLLKKQWDKDKILSVVIFFFGIVMFIAFIVSQILG